MYKGRNLIQMAEEKATEINLAVYMERLDSYIETQSALNNTLCASLEKVNDELDDMRMWRNQIYGAKAIAIAIGILILHTSAVMGSFVALINYMNK
jgi:hypothetical protein|tara:strand:+ start:736 stop:1023 length:288 start_codon:yes stop_codon:yes gene_type:complete